MTFLLPFLTALLLGAVGLTRQAWRDEHSTWWAATMPWPDLRSLLSHMDIVLAPYYFFMRGWVFAFGDSVVAMRVPSLLAMATAAGLTAVLGARLFTPWIGVTGGCLFAVIPSVSRYAEEARPYALAICFAVASVLAVVHRRWGLVSLFVALTGLAHLVALAVLVAHVPLLFRRGAAGDPDPLVSAERRRWRWPWDVDHAPVARWAIAVVIGLVPVIPFVVLGARQTVQVDWIHATWKSLATLPMSLTRSAVVAGVLAGLAVLALFADRVAWLVVWAAGPPVLIFLATPQFFYYRYLLFTLPALALLAAVGAGRALSRRGALATAVLCATILVLGARDQVTVRKSPLPGDQDYQGAASYVAQRLAPGDTAYFEGFPDHREQIGFAYELRHRAAPGVCAELGSCQRVWLVSNRVVPPPAGFAVLDAQHFAGLEVQLLRRAP